jgi:hypothetical protein
VKKEMTSEAELQKTDQVMCKENEQHYIKIKKKLKKLIGKTK